MHAAVVHLSTDKFLVAMGASELLKSCKHLPEDLGPRDLLLSEEEDKLVYVPVFVALVLGDHIAMKIDEQIGLGALRPLALVAGVQRSTIYAPVQLIVLFFEQELKLLHE